MTDLYDPLTHEETLELAVFLDNVEEILKLHDLGLYIDPGMNETYRLKIRKWVDRLCE